MEHNRPDTFRPAERILDVACSSTPQHTIDLVDPESNTLSAKAGQPHSHKSR
jgi:hypothetical protein